MHRKSVATALFMVWAATFVAPGTASAADEWIGTWKLNLAKSKFDPPTEAPKSRTLTLEGVEGGLKTVIDETDAQGKPVRTEYAVQFDNKDVPWTGPVDADTVAMQRLDDEYFQAMWKLKGEAVVLSSALVSKDRRTLTITLHGKDAQGEKIAHVTVYDRQ